MRVTEFALNAETIVLHTVKATGVYFGLLLPISRFYVCTFTWIQRCIWSCLSLGVGVEVSGSLYVCWATIKDIMMQHPGTCSWENLLNFILFKMKTMFNI